jgi:hypothetical protein
MDDHLNKKLLYQFMSFLDGIPYSPTDDIITFSAERLASITADDIVRYFNFKAYGTQYPTEEDENTPPLSRSVTLLYHRKVISYFMKSAGAGNPTRSSEVQNVIKKLRTYEIGHDVHHRRSI